VAVEAVAVVRAADTNAKAVAVAFGTAVIAGALALPCGTEAASPLIVGELRAEGDARIAVVKIVPVGGARTGNAETAGQRGDEAGTERFDGGPPRRRGGEVPAQFVKVGFAHGVISPLR
jgi:hypothetical protein